MTGRPGAMPSSRSARRAKGEREFGAAVGGMTVIGSIPVEAIGRW
jgi:hypothetical protein